jgi:hypothetical protein
MSRPSIVSVRLASPFIVFSSVWLLVLAGYHLDWSELYPNLQAPIFVLTLLICVSSWVMARIDSDFFGSVSVDLGMLEPRSAEVRTVGLLWGLSFVHNGGIPFFQVSSGDLDYQVYEFGLPLVHVLLLTYTSVLSLRAASIMHFDPTARNALLSILMPLLAVLIYSRSALIIYLAALAYIHLTVARRPLRSIAYLSIAALAIAVVFGLLGNIRLAFQVIQAGESAQDFDGVLALLAMPSRSFLDTGLPLSAMWSYLYTTSPLANLQTIAIVGIEGRSYTDFFLTQLIPDIISKRLPFEVQEVVNRQAYVISPSLFVGTTFFGPYYYAGWFGVTFMWIWIVLIWRLLVAIGLPGEWLLILFATFTSLLLMSLFDNMVRFSACSLQPIWCIVLGAYFSIARRGRQAEAVR